MLNKLLQGVVVYMYLPSVSSEVSSGNKDCPKYAVYEGCVWKPRTCFEIWKKQSFIALCWLRPFPYGKFKPATVKTGNVHFKFPKN